MAIIQGQNKQTKLQERTTLKQWALDHKDFEAFKGDKIDIIQSIGTVFISASGVALENGQKGEKIRVMNLSSEKNLVAWVLNEKKVTTQTKINRN